MATWTTRNIPDQSRKLAIITGATGGLGLETALGLAGAGAEVVLGGRNPTKGRNAEALIRQKCKNAKVRFELADMAAALCRRSTQSRDIRQARAFDQIPVHNRQTAARQRRR